MKFLIITHVAHKLDGINISAYAPYVREMNLWLKHVDEVVVVAPKISERKSAIDLDYNHKSIRFTQIPTIQFTTLKESLSSVIKLPVIIWTIYKACKKADHIHLRCPGNIGLLGCFIQILFPKKSKTAKYAGNWDPKAKQPLSYKFQKWILSNTFLTRNMQVLVYGKWNNQTKNIKAFFTASYTDEERDLPKTRSYSGALKFVFVGSLVHGKRPLLAIKIVQELRKKLKNVQLDIFGDGILREELEHYIKDNDLHKNDLHKNVTFHGNKDKEVIKEAFKDSHFLILPSKSEGWPKAIAEAMFFGTIPIATSISCVPFMLDDGKRGIIIDSKLEDAVKVILGKLSKGKELKEMSKLASNWSQNYTLNIFETEIAKLL